VSPTSNKQALNIDFARFAATVADYRLLPRALATPAAALIVLAELTIAAGLLFAVGTATCALAGAALLTLYLGAIAINLARGRRSIDCGCLGPVGSSGHGLSWWLAPRNLALIAPAFILAASEPGSRTLGVLDGAAITAAVATGLALYVGADQLVANQSLIRNLVR
jgi:hypothetical protein